jgi:PST family polysaccharide transporter
MQVLTRSDEERGGVRRVALSSVALLADSGIRIVLVTVVALWMARVLGPEQFGALNFASACVAIGWGVAGLGLDTPTTARLSSGADPRDLLGTAIVLRVAFAVVVVLALLFGSTIAVGSGEHASLALQVACFGILGASASVVDTWFKSRADALPPSLARIFATIVAVGARVGLLLAGFGVVGLAATIALEGVLVGLALLVAFAASKDAPRLKELTFDSNQARSLIRSGWPYFLSAAAMAGLMKMDTVMLGLTSGPKDVGIYSVAQKMSEVLYVVPIVILDSAYSLLARARTADQKSTAASEQTYFDLSMAGTLIFTLIALILGGPAISLLFGDAYSESTSVFLVHAWTAIPIALNASRQRWLAIRERHSYAALPAIVGLALSFFLNLLLIPAYGPMGAAFASLAAYFSFGYLLSFLIPELRPVAVLQTRSFFPWVRLARLALDRHRA